MSYPVAYRRQATAPGRGSQTSPARSVPRQSPPKPANDNWPAPANDNHPPRRPPSPARQAAAGFGRRAAPYARGALRLGRVHPVVGRVADVAELVAGYYDRRVAEARAFSKAVPYLSPAYVLQRVCNGGGPISHISTLSGWGTSCGAAATFVASDVSMGVQQTNARDVFMWDYESPYITEGFSRYWRRQHWKRPLNAPGAYVAATRALLYWPLPLMPPMADPMSLPVNEPAATPEPVPHRWLPYRRPNPYRSPSEGHQFGYEISPSRLGSPMYSVSSNANPSTPPRPVSPPGHPQPPGPKVHERKTRLRGAMAGILRGAYAVSEGIDAIDAVFNALPAKYRKGAKTPQDKLYRIWKHSKHLDMRKAALNLIANHYLDKIIGGSSAKADAFIKRITGHHSLPNIWVGV